MRDTHKSFDHFDVFIKRRHVLLYETDYWQNYEDYFPERSDGSRDLTPLLDGIISGRLEILLYMYSRGDAVADMKRLIVDPVFHDYPSVLREMDKYWPDKLYDLAPRPKRFRAYTSHSTIVCRYYSVYCWLCWALCMGVERDKVSRVIPYLCEAGKERLTDTVIDYFYPGRDIAENCTFPEVFGLLDQVIDADTAQREALVKEYLEKWPQFIGKLGGYGSLGVLCTGKAKTKEDLFTYIDENYNGYWALEAALVVKFFNIDDSSFKDNEFYPYDLVHFMPPFEGCYD